MPLSVRELDPHLTQCRLLSNKWHPDPSGHLASIDIGRGCVGKLRKWGVATSLLFSLFQSQLPDVTQYKFNFISSMTCNNYRCTSAFGMILRIAVRIQTLGVGTPFPLVQKCLWERHSHTKISMGTAFPRVPAPLHPWWRVCRCHKLLKVACGKFAAHDRSFGSTFSWNLHYPDGTLDELLAESNESFQLDKYRYCREQILKDFQRTMLYIVPGIWFCYHLSVICHCLLPFSWP